MAVGEPIKRRLSKACVTGASSLGDLDEAQCDQFADRRGDSVTMEAELGEVLIRAWEPTVLLGLPAMLREFNLEPGHSAVGG
jgi:hypothetical protein